MEGALFIFRDGTKITGHSRPDDIVAKYKRLQEKGAQVRISGKEVLKIVNDGEVIHFAPA